MARIATSHQTTATDTSGRPFGDPLQPSCSMLILGGSPGALVVELPPVPLWTNAPGAVVETLVKCHVLRPVRIAVMEAALPTPTGSPLLINGEERDPVASRDGVVDEGCSLGGEREGGLAGHAGGHEGAASAAEEPGNGSEPGLLLECIPGGRLAGRDELVNLRRPTAHGARRLDAYGLALYVHAPP